MGGVPRYEASGLLPEELILNLTHPAPTQTPCRTTPLKRGFFLLKVSFESSPGEGQLFEVLVKFRVEVEWVPF
jgi:hypothetical protein